MCDDYLRQVTYKAGWRFEKAKKHHAAVVFAKYRIFSGGPSFWE